MRNTRADFRYLIALARRAIHTQTLTDRERYHRTATNLYKWALA